MKKSRTILRVLAALMAVMLMTMSGAPALAASFKARINSSSAKVYNVPSTSSKVYVQGGRGITVTVTGYANGWARIKYNGNTGYTLVKNLNLVNRPKGYTKKSTAVYRQDSTSSTRMGTLSAGSTVYVVGMSGNFYRVQNASGSVTGYVQKGTLATKSAMTAAYKKYLAYIASLSAGSSSGSSTSGGSSSSGSTSGGSTSSGSISGGSTSGGSTSGGSTSGGSTSGGSTSGGSTSGGSTSGGGTSSGSGSTTSSVNTLITLARVFIGKPYASSAQPPSSFNCSAYVNYCFEKFGYDMENTAAKQCADSRYTRISDISKIQPGDILCFATDNDENICDHTAIYVGNNKFLEASQKAAIVQENTLTDWYKARFICARRVF